VKADSLLEVAKEMARQIADKPPLGVEAIRKLLRLVQSPGLKEPMQEETELFGEPCATEDKKEGLLAFLGNRKAEFQGKQKGEPTPSHGTLGSIRHASGRPLNAVDVLFGRPDSNK
jgi:hypothetical protein